MARIEGSKAFDLLIELLGHEEYRGWALRALRQRRDPAAIPFLQNAKIGDKEQAKFRDQIVERLKKIAEKKATGAQCGKAPESGKTKRKGRRR